MADEPTTPVPASDTGGETPTFKPAAGRRVFGRFLLEAEVGRGGMGVVWRALDAELERTVALKFLPEIVAGDAEAVRNLKRETQRCLEVTHPNIVRVYDFVVEGPAVAISMELVDGQSLFRRKVEAKNGCLEVDELAPLVAQLCDALDYAHQTAKVVHRDLKPANILLTRDGTAKITDFGIARSLSATHLRLTGRLGDASGTLPYMSPQQLVGGDPVPADDIYALGATLYELLTGRPPFCAGDLPTQIREITPKRVNSHRAALELPPVPQAWDKTIAACLAKEPGDRPRSAGEVARRLGLDVANGRGPSSKKGGQNARVKDRASKVATQKSLAVLAFTNLSGEKENEYFSDGISEELGNVLAKVPGLTVCGPASAFHFKGKPVPISEIGKQLGVAYVVAGSVRRSGERVRITAQLIDAASGFTAWSSEPLTRELKDIFAVQDEIAGLIATKLSLTMGIASGPVRTVNPEAYRLVLEGRYFWNLRTMEGYAHAEDAFNRAIGIDPGFAEAHAGLAGVCVIRANNEILDGLGAGSIADLERASVEALRAIQLDPTLPDGYATLGFRYLLCGNMEESDRQFQRALALAPNSALTRDWHALLENSRGRLDAGLAEYAKAAEIDPLWFINLQMLAWTLRRSQQWEKALKMNERAAALRTDVFVINLSAQAEALMALGRRDDAVAAARLVERNLETQPRWASDSIAIRVLVQAGLKPEADDYAAQLFAIWPRDDPRRGTVLGALGRFDEALPFLERIPVALRLNLYWDEMWDRWRDEPRFRQLMQKLNCADSYTVARATLARMLQEQRSRNPAGDEN